MQTSLKLTGTATEIQTAFSGFKCLLVKNYQFISAIEGTNRNKYQIELRHSEKDYVEDKVKKIKTIKGLIKLDLHLIELYDQRSPLVW